MKFSLRFRIGSCLLILVLLSVACNMPSGAKIPPTPTPLITLPTLTPQIINPSAPTPTITTTATLTTEPPKADTPTPDVLKQISYEGVTFTAPEKLFTGTQMQISPVYVSDGGMDWMGPTPEGIQFRVTVVGVQGDDNTGTLTVYPLESYIQANEIVKGEVDALMSLLANKPAHPEAPLPFIPPVPAAELTVMNVQYFNFSNGSGIRYLTVMGQDAGQITSERLLYSFLGITTDGKYLITADVPINHPVLKTPEVTGLYDITKLQTAEEYKIYADKVRQIIETQTPESFTPSLKTLDTIFQSLAAQPTRELASPLPACEGAMVSRMKLNLKARVTFTDGTPLRVRKDPGLDGAVINKLAEGTGMTILDGPKCVSNAYWWYMESDKDKITGWVMEGQKNVYYLEPQP